MELPSDRGGELHNTVRDIVKRTRENPVTTSIQFDGEFVCLSAAYGVAVAVSGAGLAGSLGSERAQAVRSGQVTPRMFARLRTTT